MSVSTTSVHQMQRRIVIWIIDDTTAARKQLATRFRTRTTLSGTRMQVVDRSWLELLDERRPTQAPDLFVIEVREARTDAGARIARLRATFPASACLLILDESVGQDQASQLAMIADRCTIRTEEAALTATGRVDLVMEALQARRQVRDMEHIQAVERRQRGLAAIGTVLAGVAHKFNHQLSRILAEAERLEDGAAAAGGIIGAAAERCATMIDSLTSLVEGPGREEVYAIHEPVDRALQLTRRIFERERIEIELVMSGESLTSRGDPREVFAALVELLLVTRDRLARSTIRHLGVTLLRDPDCPERARLMISWTDDADDFSDQVALDPVLERIASCLQRQCGEVQFETSADDRRLRTTSILLPLAFPAHGRIDQRTASGDDTRPCALIIEDESCIRLLLKDLLEELGFAVLEAGNGAQALDTVRSRTIDLIVLDMQMPVMDGRVFLSHLVEHCRRLPPLVVCSGWITEEDMALLDAMGIHEIVRKPFRRASLQEAIVRAVPQQS